MHIVPPEVLTEPRPTPPVTLQNGFVPLQVYTQDNGPDHFRDGSHRFTGLVMAERAEKDLRPFNHDSWATWVIHYDFDRECWESTSGRYHSEINDARRDFGGRLINELWGASVRGLRGE